MHRCFGIIAQTVEHRTENPGVPGSIPGGTTRKEVIESIRPYRIRSKGYCFQIEMKFTAFKLGYKIVEIPIIFTDRRLGTSKMSGGIFNEALWGVLRMKIMSWFSRYRKNS